ncbi:MAG: hypothetical protein IT371_08795 [Deltaproteobacteria bacterium]|nr:hypothetical protein [Deltaproteobacteria bacterium]
MYPSTRRRCALAALAFVGAATLTRPAAAEPWAPRAPLRGAGIALPRRVPAFMQNAVLRNTCGPSAVTAALRYWLPGFELRFPDEMQVVQLATQYAAALKPLLARTAPHPTFLWNDADGLAAAARHHGLYAKVERGVRTDGFTNQLASWLALGETPVVWGLLDGVSPDSGHFRVVEGVDAVGVHLMDPWPDSPRYDHVPWATFERQFHNALVPEGLAIRLSAFPTPLLTP